MEKLKSDFIKKRLFCKTSMSKNDLQKSIFKKQISKIEFYKSTCQNRFSEIVFQNSNFQIRFEMIEYQNLIFQNFQKSFLKSSIDQSFISIYNIDILCIIIECIAILVL